MNGLLLGLTLGLGAGVAPGPLLALVLRSALQAGFAAGARVAFSPLITDLPIVLVAVTVATTVPDTALGMLSILGGVFLLWLGVEALRESPIPATTTAAPSVRRGILMGALTNILSPHPWVFWITVGAPILGASTAGGAALFLVGFYLLLIGSKVAFAAALAAGRNRLLQGRGYLVVLRLSGLLLLGAAVLLVVEGLRAVT